MRYDAFNLLNLIKVELFSYASSLRDLLFVRTFLHNALRVQDTVTGFLLAGIGQRDSSGSNFLVVDASESYRRGPLE